MSNTPPPVISGRRSLALAAGASAGAIALMALPLPAPPADPDLVLDWWELHGAAHAAIAIVRVTAIAIAVYVALLGALASLSALARFRHLAHTIATGLPAGLHRSLLGVGMTATSLTPAVAAAADTEPAPAAFVLFDIGAAGTESTTPGTPTAAGPSPTSESVVSPSSTAAITTAEDSGVTAPSDTWIVQRGDHLWGIAEETLSELGDGEKPSERQVARYWTRLIEENESMVGPDPDMIHPGVTLVLPPV